MVLEVHRPITVEATTPVAALPPYVPEQAEPHAEASKMSAGLRAMADMAN
ncbi:hypothetical protein [Nocardia farcinica]|nr:hypothetical protein [Nocardia farcinica]MBF6271685.1 hypothetical protein [Nocardia farcinica]MCZ9330405.1 hypothetical protein [Nocardia farcinica]